MATGHTPLSRIFALSACGAAMVVLTLACSQTAEDAPSLDSSTGGSVGTGSGSGAESGGSSSSGSGGGLSDPASGGQASASGGAMNGDLTHATSAELVASLGLGWNLGNSLDAPEGETAWGNPVVTPTLLQAVHDAGFDVVRIPVTWSLHQGDGPDYTIDPEFMNRVSEVVDDCLDAGLYAIINVHHDGADGYSGVEWLTLNDEDGNVTEMNNGAVRARFGATWKQIAGRFSEYGEQLLFEGMNEIHDGYDTPDPAYYSIINDLNQLFVDTVRASSGNNAARHLVVPGYNTNIDYTIAGFVAPTDPTPNHLILSVHFYDPWSFAGGATTQTWGSASPGSDDWGQESSVTGQFDKLKQTYIDQGLPVLMGEYGAVHQDGYEEYRRYYLEYVTKSAHDRGILPVLWDNGSHGSGEEAFGMIDRTSETVLYPDMMDALNRAVTSDYALSDVALPMP